MKTHRKSAFTLIELLTVIAVIAILAGILIPVTGGVIRQSRIASSKARLWQYITALESFKAEYNYYPQVYTEDTNKNGLIDLKTKSEDFISALSGSGGRNYRGIQFYSFSENEFLGVTTKDANGNDVVTRNLLDSFGNDKISILIDANGDGTITPNSTDPVSPGAIKNSATAWVEANNNNPGYALWE